MAGENGEDDGAGTAFAETGALHQSIDLKAGHRDRLRQRFARVGANGLEDYELLELVLFRCIPRRDTKPLAKRLLAHFRSLGGVMGASVEELKCVPGVGDATALDLRLIGAVATNVVKGNINKREVLTSWSAVLEYCKAAMAFENREQFRVLFMDKKNGLIGDEVMQTGTIDHTPVYPREVLRRCIELAATAIVLVHNHPSGDPTPSNADIQMTAKIVEALSPMNIVVHDHIIIGKDGHASLKALSLM